jgi:hypothetical protein
MNVAGMGIGSGHGYSAGGTLPEKIIGLGMNSGTPYSFGSGEQVSPAGQSNSANASGLPGMNMYQANTMISLLGQLVKIGQQTPASYARALNGAVGNPAANRAGYKTGFACCPSHASLFNWTYGSRSGNAKVES